MKVAVFLATLYVRLLGVYLLFSSATGLIALTLGGVGHSVNDRFAIILVIQIGLGAVAVTMAGRVVQLFTRDAYLGNE